MGTLMSLFVTILAQSASSSHMIFTSSDLLQKRLAAKELVERLDRES